MTEQTEKNSNQLTIVGVVVSNKMNKSIVVQVERKVKHPAYGKYVRRFTKLVAHDETNTSNIGDTVKIERSRPLSKTKCWKLIEVLKRVEGV